MLKEVPPDAEILEGTSIAGNALQTENIESAAKDRLPLQSRSNENSWIAFIWRLLLFGTTNYCEVLTVLIIVAFSRIHVALWV